MLDPVVMRGQSFERRWKHLLFVSARLFVVPLLRLGLRLKIYGLQHVPRRGGALLICNHLNWFDPVLLLACSPRPVLFMAKSEAFETPVVRWFARTAGAFPVRRGRADRVALKHAEQRLSEGMLVGMFPEGTRSRTGGLIAAHAGVSMVALRSGAPIIPCALVGMDYLPMAGTRRPLRGYPKVTTIFGEPFHLLLEKPEGGRWSFDDLTDAMMIEMARLLPPEMRGVYGERANETHPAVDRSRIQFSGPHAAQHRAAAVATAGAPGVTNPGRFARLKQTVLRPFRSNAGTAGDTAAGDDTVTDTVTDTDTDTNLPIDASGSV